MKKIVAILLILAGLAPIPATATYVTFTNRNNFLSATLNATNIDFEGILSQGQDFGGDGSMTIGGVSFVGYQDNGQLGMGIGNDQALINGATRLNWGSGDSLVFEVGFLDIGGYLLASLPRGIGAIGFDYFAYDDSDPDGVPSSFNFTIGNVGIFTGNSLNQPSRAFFGVISDTAIDTVRIELSDGDGRPPIPAIDNFLMANLDTPTSPPVPVPEPGTGLLVVLALGILAFCRNHLSAKV